MHAGILDGHRATTHWMHLDELKTSFPAVEVDRCSLFVRDDVVWTSAGVAAGIDPSIELVREIFGGRAASVGARRMITPPHRSGGQSQFIEPVAHAPPLVADEGGVTVAMDWASENLGRPITVADLAERALMSERSFLRQFRHSVGISPLQWIIERRIAYARRLLEETSQSVETIAHESGFGAAANLRSQFSSRLQTTPARYRAEFRSGTSEDRSRRVKDDSSDPTASRTRA